MKESKEFSEENRSYKLFKSNKPISAIRKNIGREYIDSLNREKSLATNIRELKKKDVREFVEVSLGFNMNPSTSMGFPAGKSSDEIISNLQKFDTEDNFFILADRNDRFVGFCGIESYENIYAKELFFIHGPLVNYKFQKRGNGDKLLKETLEFAKIKGFSKGVTAINSKNIVGEKLLLKNGFKQFKSQLILEEKRASRVRIYKNSKDKIFIVENSDNIDSLYKLFKLRFPHFLIDESRFKNLLDREDRLIFICKRDENLSGFMEVAFSNTKFPEIISFDIDENYGDNDTFRLLLFSVIQFVFKNRETSSLKLRLDNELEEFMEEINKFDFRQLEQLNWYIKKI